MTLAESLLDRASEYLPQDKMSTVEEAYRFAEAAHATQVRMSGEPFIEHPIHTALYLAELKLDSNALAAALLHDVMEDCGVSFEELSDKFGSEVASLVDGVTKLTKTEFRAQGRGRTLAAGSDEDRAQAGSIRKMLMAMAEDVRVVLIKLADRLHNMRTLNALAPERRIVIAQETLDIYAPLAHRLGIWEMKWLLEDLAFQHIHPDAYREVSRSMNLDTTDDFFAALGSGAITTAQVVGKLASQEIKPQDEHLVPLPTTGPGSGVTVLGVGDLLTRMAPCCNPIRGDEISGYVTRNRGVTVHRATCPNVVNETERERLVQVGWGETQTLYPVRITIEAWDRVGLLRDITSLVSDERVNIASCVSEEFDDISVISLTVYIDGINQLSRLFSKLEAVEGVNRVSREHSHGGPKVGVPPSRGMARLN